MRGGILRLVAARHADRHDDRAVVGEDDARCAGRSAPGVGHEDVLDVGEGGAPVEPGARQRDRGRAPRGPARGRGRAFRDRLRIGEVDEPVVGVARMDRDVHHPGAPGAHVRLGHAGDRLRIEHAVADDPQPPPELGDQDVAVRQERERPGVREPRDRHHAKRLPARIREDPRSVGKRNGRRVRAAGGCPARERHGRFGRGRPRLLRDRQGRAERHRQAERHQAGSRKMSVHRFAPWPGGTPRRSDAEGPRPSRDDNGNNRSNQRCATTKKWPEKRRRHSVPRGGGVGRNGSRER